jgi:hypothetical protein
MTTDRYLPVQRQETMQLSVGITGVRKIRKKSPAITQSTAEGRDIDVTTTDDGKKPEVDTYLPHRRWRSLLLGGAK